MAVKKKNVKVEEQLLLLPQGLDLRSKKEKAWYKEVMARKFTSSMYLEYRAEKMAFAEKPLEEDDWRESMIKYEMSNDKKRWIYRQGWLNHQRGDK